MNSTLDIIGRNISLAQIAFALGVIAFVVVLRFAKLEPKIEKKSRR